jgi:hypothetical protein
MKGKYLSYIKMIPMLICLSVEEWIESHVHYLQFNVWLNLYMTKHAYACYPWIFSNRGLGRHPSSCKPKITEHVSQYTPFGAWKPQ